LVLPVTVAAAAVIAAYAGVRRRFSVTARLYGNSYVYAALPPLQVGKW